MEQSKSRSCILKLLRKRNAKEHCFKDIIKYSSKLLESLDYMQKEGIQRQLQATKLSSESSQSSNCATSEESKLKMKCYTLQKENAECHTKISGLAQQVINLKDQVDEKILLVGTQNAELEQLKVDIKTYQDRCKMLSSEIVYAKKLLQDKADEYDALNITYSCMESKRNDLENGNKKLRTQLSMLRERREKSSSNESLTSNKLTGSNKSLNKVDENETVKVPSVKPLSEMGNSCQSVLLPEKIKFEFGAHESEVNALLWMPDSSHLITAGSDRRVKVWEIGDTDVKLMNSVRDCNSSILSIDTNSEASLVLSASCDFASRVWSVSDFTLRHTLTGHSGKVMSSKFMKEKGKIMSGSSDQTLKLWDFGRRVCTVTYIAHSQANDLVSRDPNTVISGHNDSKIRIWDMRIDSETANIHASGKITSLDVSSSGSLLLSSEQDNTLKLYDLRTYAVLKSMSAKNFEIGCSWTRAKLSPKDKYCCCGSKNGSVFVWNLSSGAVEKELRAHNSNVISCSWSPCGSYLASCESNRKCIVWSK